MTPCDDVIRRRVRGLIAETHVTAQAFSHTARVNPSRVSRFLNGHVDLREDEKSRWASALGIPVNQVFGG